MENETIDIKELGFEEESIIRDEHMERSQECYNLWLKFFDKDVSMKQELSDLMPDLRFSGDKEYALKVSDRMYDGVRDLKTMFLNAAGPFMASDEQQYVNEWAKNTQIKIAEAGLDVNKLHKVYMDTIGNMSPEFVKNVNENIFGYSIWGRAMCPVSQAKTFNEILHRMHVVLERDNSLHDRFPHSNDVVNDLTVFGEHTQLTKQLEASLALMFDTVNPKRSAGPISIVSINDDSALIMLRDMGHATTIRIEREDDENIYLNYYIPKINNEEMVRQLPGFQSMAQTDGKNTYAVGEMVTDSSKLGIDVLTLAYNIPSDCFMMNERYDATTGTWKTELGMPEEEYLFKTAEEIISCHVSTDCFSTFVEQNPDYVCSEIGMEAVMRGCERECPGYLMNCINEGFQLPTGIVQSINNGEFPYLSSVLDKHDAEIQNEGREP